MLLRVTVTAIVFLSAMGTTSADDPEKQKFQQLHRLSKALREFNFPDDRDRRITVWRQVGGAGISATIDEDEVSLKYAIDSFFDGESYQDIDLENIAVLSSNNRRIRFFAYEAGSSETTPRRRVHRGDLVVVLSRSDWNKTLATAKDSSPINDQDGTWSTQGEVLVVVPSTRTTIAAYSIPKGTWDRVELESPLEKEANASISGSLAAFQTKDSVYAFSAETGRWARLKLPVDDSQEPVAAAFAIHDKMVRVTTHDQADKIYVFSVNSIEWSGIDLNSGQRLPVVQ